MPGFDDYRPEMEAIEAEGWAIVGKEVRDWGMTLILDLERGGEKARVPLSECVYDTDSKGGVTRFHGVIDVRISPWSRGLRSH